METSEELKKWVESLTVAEKRFIKLIGKARAGANTSQQLDLFDWLNQSKVNATLPPKAKFRQNLPTVANRLKDLILDGLRILHKEDNTEALLRTTLDEIAILHEKKLYRAANKQLKRTKKLALETCRYGFALQCIEWEQKIAQVEAAGNLMDVLKGLREEENAALKKYTELKELQYRHDLILVRTRQFFFHRDAKTLKEVHDLSDHELVYRLSKSGGYVEQALAVNILGMKNFFERNPISALPRYQKLLLEWKSHPAWQIDQSALLLLICKVYQTACFHCAIDWEEARSYLNIVSDFKGMSADANRDFLLMIYQNQFTLALNTGKFESVKTQLPEIDRWLTQETKHLNETQVLPFLCNFAVAEFLNENFAAANQLVIRILHMPNRNARKDIREFALVLQAVLQFELDDSSLNEYLTRAGKRHFSKHAFEVNFELIVFECLETIVRDESSRKTKASIQKLIAQLDHLADQSKDSIPLLGLNEIRMWAKSKQTGESLREVFLQEVQRNLEMLEQTELL